MKAFKKFFFESLTDTINLSPFQKADLHNILMTAKENDGIFKANFQNKLIEKNAILLLDSPNIKEISEMVPTAKQEASSNVSKRYDIQIDPNEGCILYIFEEIEKNPKTIIIIQSTKTELTSIKEISFDVKENKSVHEDIIWQPSQNDETKINHLINNLS